MLKKLLGFDSTTMTLRTESIAGITTFLTMSYILAVNTSILSDVYKRQHMDKLRYVETI